MLKGSGIQQCLPSQTREHTQAANLHGEEQSTLNSDVENQADDKHSSVTSLQDFHHSVDTDSNCSANETSDNDLDCNVEEEIVEQCRAEEIDPNSSESDDENIENDTLLYQDAPITQAESILSILTFVLTHRLTGTCLIDLLTLISIHCPIPNLCCTTLYRFKQFFATLQNPLVRHFYCIKCSSSLATKDTVCALCGQNEGVKYFIQLPILKQVRTLFQRPRFYETLSHRFTRVKQNADNYEDIYDGAIYKELSGENEILSNQSNVSFTWYTDGISIFKSSKFSIWPLYLTINELPYSQRTQKENVILAGLWFGNRKPEPNLYLEVFREELCELNNGIDVRVHGLQDSLPVRGIVLCGTCDLPAKALFMNMKQYNGFYGCQKCKIKGEIFQGQQVFPYASNIELRTEPEHREHAEKAHNNGQPELGVKGPSILSVLVYQFIRTTAVDPMHCLFSGLAKKLLTIWFDPSFHDHPASLSRFIKVIDKRIAALKPPYFVQRLPRNISEHWAYWKASELKNWLLYYSLPIMCDVMLEEYLNHHKLLVLGVFLLHQKSVSEDMIVLASRALNKYVSEFEGLYGKRHMTNNLHQLLHLPLVVKDFGPLWVISCFPFEDINGKLENLVHGTRYAPLQICSTMSLFSHLTSLKSVHLHPGRKATEFCERLGNMNKRLKLQFIKETIAIVGKYKKYQDLDGMIQTTLENFNIIGNHYYVFQRALVHDQLYVSESYKMVKTTSSCVRYSGIDGTVNAGIVITFTRVSICLCRDMCVCLNGQNYAIIRKCNLERTFVAPIPGGCLPFMQKCISQDEVVAIPIDNLCGMYFCINISDDESTYFVEAVNDIEKD